MRYKTEAEALGAIAALNESSMDGLPCGWGQGMGVGIFWLPREVDFSILASKTLPIEIQEMQDLLGLNMFEPSGGTLCHRATHIQSSIF